MIMWVEFETSLERCIEIARCLKQVYISQRSEEYLIGRLSVILVKYNVQ